MIYPVWYSVPGGVWYGGHAGRSPSLEADRDCTDLMRLVAACRGALNPFLAELVEDCIRDHMVDPDRRPTSRGARAAQEIIDLLRGYVT
jgi:DNA-binding FrmR family transcriptional regulator